MFTYFDDPLQLEVLTRMTSVMHDEGALVIGGHEKLPRGSRLFLPWFDKQRVFRKSSASIGEPDK